VIQDIIRRAIFYENRGYSEQAFNEYRKLIGFEQQLPLEVLSRMVNFFYSMKQFELAFSLAKLAIEQGGELEQHGYIYLESWKRKDHQSLQELEWLLFQPGINYRHKLNMEIAKQLYELGEYDKSYFLSIKIKKTAEKLLKESDAHADFFIETILHMIRLEYQFSQLTQARYQLRKLLYIKPALMKCHNEIAYWSLVLDEAPNFVTRNDWYEIVQYLSSDVQVLCQVYRKIYENSVSRADLEQVASVTCQDKLLERKKELLWNVLKRGFRNRDWKDDFCYEHCRDKHNLLATLLQSEILLQKNKEEAKNLWKETFLYHADKPEAIKAYWNVYKKGNAGSMTEPVSITFFGGGEKIGGTSILVSVNNHHILLDAGIHLHEETYFPDYSPMQHIGIKWGDIDALLISHAHLDHVGAVPYVHKRCPSLPIFATEATIDLMRIMLLDVARTGNSEEAVGEMYTESEVYETILSMNKIDFKQTIRIPSKDTEWKVTFYRAGHIVGAAAIHLEINDVSILFTGDFSIEDQKTVKGLQLPPDLRVDILITESTYGYLPMNAAISRERQEKLLVEAIVNTVNKNGNMLIPSFALGRAQEIILIIKEAFRHLAYLPFDLYLDGRVIDICRVYEKFAKKGRFLNKDYCNYGVKELFFGNGVQSAKDLYRHEFYRDNERGFSEFFDDYIKKGGNCIIASSGMLLDNSSSARYAERLLEDSKNTIAFTGYLDEESPGHAIHALEAGSNRKTKINQKEKEVLASIESFRLSAHAGREEILQLILTLQPAYVFLMHGEHQKMYEPISCIKEGNDIYPTLIDLLSYLKNDTQTIPAFNGQTYQI